MRGSLRKVFFNDYNNNFVNQYIMISSKNEKLTYYGPISHKFYFEKSFHFNIKTKQKSDSKKSLFIFKTQNLSYFFLIWKSAL